MKPRTFLPLALAGFSALVLPCVSWGANEIGFIERFALAPDREKVLGELVPGSEDYYFFHALHYQNTRNEAKLADILAQWKKRFPDENQRRRTILNREALLDYDKDAKGTLEYLKKQLGLEFNHQQEARDKAPDLPVRLDPALISRQAFEKDALIHDSGLASLSQEALEQLVINKVKLDEEQRRALLVKIARPDVPGLVALIVTDLKSKDAPEFGAFPIHKALLLEQLDELATAIPKLKTEEAFVFAKLRKLAPDEDEDAEFDAAVREAWLTRVWDYVKTLPASFNTLKAGVLYRRLDHDWKKGVYDAARFMEYLKLPRQLGYVNQKWLERTLEKVAASDLAAGLGEPLLTERPIGNDEPLVREYFLEIFQRAAANKNGTIGVEMIAPYTEYVRDSWLKPVLAEALITGGHGSPEQWSSLLSGTAFQRLKERVDIEFPATNPAFTTPGDDVKFDVVLKNTPKLLVKIYELNTLNFFQSKKRQLNTDVNLDGLIANTERAETIDAGPFKRTRQTFNFPELKGKRGAWIVEFIGGGRSSRALIRSGQWQVLQQTMPGGVSVMVLDEKKQPVPDAVVWLDGRKFERDAKTKLLTVPFTAQPGLRPLIVADAAGAFATLTQFQHSGEGYKLDATFHIEREQLLARRPATLAVRTALLLGELHLDPALMQEPVLTITSVTHDGISTTREVKDLKLRPDAVLTHEIAVPERLATLKVTLSGKIDVLSSGGVKADLNASHTWTLNGMDRTDATNDGHLSLFGGEYVYELLGKNGEPVADQQVVFSCFHREFARAWTIPLKTDKKGRIALGSLAGIKRFTAKAPNERESSWTLDDYERTWPAILNSKAGEPVQLPLPPYFTDVLKLDGEMRADWVQRAVSLLEVKAGTFTVNHAAKLKVLNGFLIIEGLAPGDYSLRLRGDERIVSIRVAEAARVGTWLLGHARNLQQRDATPLHVQDVVEDKEFITVKLANVTPFTRVHIAATRFHPGTGLFGGLGGFTRFGGADGVTARLPNLFSAGREIGDEYRYILERRDAKWFPGNMLTRPGLLLNPWEVRDTEVQSLAQKDGQAATRTTGGRGEGLGEVPKLLADVAQGLVGAVAETNIDFLADAAPVLFNLLPDKDGVVRIERKALGDRQHVQVYAEDPSHAVWRAFSLPEQRTKFADQRLVRNLDPVKPFSQKKEVTVLEQGRALTLADILTSEIETYDTLGGIHSLFTTLSGNTELANFAWVLQWPKLKDDEKLAKYSEFGCHELSFFLSRKDPQFFEKVIKPYLANKKDKTFIDDFLLGNDLAAYREPWAYARLNVAERTLLATRIDDEPANAARRLREQWELLPSNLDEQDRLFETALRGRALVQGGEGVVQELLEQRKRAEAGGIPGIDAPHPADPASPAPEPAAAPPAKPAARPASAAANNPSPAVTGGFLDSAAKKTGMSVALGIEEADALAAVVQEGKLKAGVGIQTLDTRSKLEATANFARQRAQDRQGGVTNAWASLADGKPADAYYFHGIKQPDFDYAGGDAARGLRRAARIYYRQLGATKEWAENNYWHLRITEQNENLVPVNAFWRDYAAHVAAGKGAFVSPNVAEASRNFSEMMLALAVLDLPFDAPRHTTKTDGGQLTFTAGGPVIVYHKEIKPAAPAAQQQGGLLVSQSFFRHGDRHRMEGNEKFEKYVTDEFLTGAVYGANVVVTNPTSSPVKAEVLLQIPQGALPVLGSKATDSRRVALKPYTTQTFEYSFYFPATHAKAGEKFVHYPVNVAVGGNSVAGAKPFAFNVVGRLTQFDKASWDYVSQYGTETEVFAFLEQNNLASLALSRVAWRCRDAAFFRKLTGFLNAHHIWDETIYSYAVVHNDAAALREWLKRNDAFVSQCGPFLSTKLLLLDPIERRSYEHLEYSPLVNQRAHRVGAEHRIANPAVLAQYRALLNIAAHKPGLDAMDSMSVTYHLFLQDRVEEALARFHGIDAKALPTALQHDYFKCYAGFYEGGLAEARGIAAKYADFPIARWKGLFAEVTSQLDELEGKAAAKKGDDKPDREKQQGELTVTEPGFDFKVEKQTIALTHRNLGEVTVNYYLMDPEFSFSSSPFVSQDAGRFGIIKPNKSAVQALAKDKDTTEIALPAEFAKANVLVEVLGAGQRKAQAYHANTLKLTVTENYGRLETRDSGNDKPVGKAYVKVYAKLKNGTVRFYKDGYTDLRGRFDYASLNGGGQAAQPGPAEPAPKNGLDYQMLKPAEIAQVDKLAVLILSETNGATTREINPPGE